MPKLNDIAKAIASREAASQKPKSAIAIEIEPKEEEASQGLCCPHCGEPLSLAKAGSNDDHGSSEMPA